MKYFYLVFDLQTFMIESSAIFIFIFISSTGLSACGFGLQTPGQGCAHDGHHYCRLQTDSSEEC